MLWLAHQKMGMEEWCNMTMARPWFEGEFLTAGSLNSSLEILLTAVSKLRAKGTWGQVVDIASREPNWLGHRRRIVYTTLVTITLLLTLMIVLLAMARKLPGDLLAITAILTSTMGLSRLG